MNARIYAAMVGLALVIGGLGALAGLDSCRKHEGSAAEVTANIESGVASVHEQNAQAQNPAIQKLEAERDEARALAARVQGERDILRKKWDSRPIPPATLPVSAPDDRAALLGQLDLAEAVIAKDAEVIEAQDLLIKNQSESILVLTKARDEWKATAEARERQAMAQEAATRAWKDAVVTSEIKGGIKGAIGWEILRRVLGGK